MAVDTLFKMDDERLPSDVEFMTVDVRRRLDVGGLVDGVDVARLVERRVTLSNDSDVAGAFVVDAAAEAADVDVGRVNDVDVDRLVVRTAAPGQVVAGRKIVVGDIDFQVSVDRRPHPSSLPSFLPSFA